MCGDFYYAAGVSAAGAGATSGAAGAATGSVTTGVASAGFISSVTKMYVMSRSSSI